MACEGATKLLLPLVFFQQSFKMGKVANRCGYEERRMMVPRVALSLIDFVGNDCAVFRLVSVCSLFEGMVVPVFSEKRGAVLDLPRYERHGGCYR